MSEGKRPELDYVEQRHDRTLDEFRSEAAAKRHAKGYRTARENLEDLVDAGSFTEYGQLAVAAQRNRREYEELQSRTAADGVITGIGTVNGHRTAVIVYDYAVLAGTQGYFHHRKLDRICELAEDWELPVVMYTEGGGGRPGDTDVQISIAGLNITSFVTWARLSGQVPRIAINNGYCFAGNAALFGCADITVATRSSWIGMAGPAMIEGGGLGVHQPTAIGPIEVQEKMAPSISSLKMKRMPPVSVSSCWATSRAPMKTGLVVSRTVCEKPYPRTGAGVTRCDASLKP